MEIQTFTIGKIAYTAEDRFVAVDLHSGEAIESDDLNLLLAEVREEKLLRQKFFQVTFREWRDEAWHEFVPGK